MQAYNQILRQIYERIDGLQTYSIGISSQLHVSQLQPCPIGVELSGTYKSQMDTEVSMNSRTIDAQEYAICNTGPRRILGIAVEACLDIDKKAIMSH